MKYFIIIILLSISFSVYLFSKDQKQDEAKAESAVEEISKPEIVSKKVIKTTSSPEKMAEQDSNIDRSIASEDSSTEITAIDIISEYHRYRESGTNDKSVEFIKTAVLNDYYDITDRVKLFNDFLETESEEPSILDITNYILKNTEDSDLFSRALQAHSQLINGSTFESFLRKLYAQTTNEDCRSIISQYMRMPQG